MNLCPKCGCLAFFNSYFGKMMCNTCEHTWKEESQSKFEIGDRVDHYKYGEGTILGNYHQRSDGKYYWHIQYDDGTFGYNQEGSLIPTN